MNHNPNEGTRETDERLLEILTLRDKGKTGAEIGRRFGLDGSYVRKMCRSVARDLAASEAGSNDYQEV